VELHDLLTLLLDQGLFQPEVENKHTDESHGKGSAEGSQCGDQGMAPAPAISLLDEA
jgi:hypothetical protein